MINPKVGDKYKVNQIVFSLQGEGLHYGKPCIFLRFAKCNLKCSFCDTEFETYKEMTKEDILEDLMQYDCRFLSLCGGEPALQFDEPLRDMLKFYGFYILIETNGTRKLIDGIDYVIVSPKCSDKVLEDNFIGRKVSELKYVIGPDDNLPTTILLADNYLVSPMFDGQKLNEKSVDRCVELVMDQPGPAKWRMTFQNHKFWGVI